MSNIQKPNKASGEVREKRFELEQRESKPRETREGDEIGYKTGWYKKPTDYTNR